MPGETERVIGQQEKAEVSQTTTSSPWLPATPCTGALCVSRRLRQNDLGCWVQHKPWGAIDTPVKNWLGGP